MTRNSKIPLADRKIAVIIAAAGSSQRMKGSVKKQYLPLGNETVLSKSLKAFLKSVSCFSVTITIPKGEKSVAKAAIFSDKEIPELLKSTPLFFVDGGKTRQESIFNALLHLSKMSEKPEIVLIHDGARPFVETKTILETAEAALLHGAAVPGIPPTDTQKIVDEEGFIKTHLERSSMISVQTPQGFDFEKLLSAHKIAAAESRIFTDDTEIYALLSEKIKTVEGSSDNMKITYPKDCTSFASPTTSGTQIRCGLGYDLHRLVEGRKLMLGGIEIPFDKGEAAHSDGDVLLHAITDALLGASGLGDIGSYFPPEEAKWKDANSAVLLKACWSDVKKSGWKLGNIDCVIKLEKPKFIPYRSRVISSIANILEVEEEKIFVKAKTAEGLESVGEGKAIEAWVNCLLTK